MRLSAARRRLPPRRPLPEGLGGSPRRARRRLGTRASGRRARAAGSGPARGECRRPLAPALASSLRPRPSAPYSKPAAVAGPWPRSGRATTPPIPVGAGGGHRAGWGLSELPCPPWGWLLAASPEAWGRGRAAGVPPGCPGTVLAAGWEPLAESPAPVAASLRAPGRGRPGGGTEGSCTAAQVGERGGFQVSGKPGVMAIGGGFSPSPAQARAARPPGRTLLAATRPASAGPGERGITRRPPAAQPGTWLSLSWTLGPQQLPESRSRAEAGADFAGQSGFTVCPSLPGLARRGVNFLRLGLRAPRQRQVVLGPASGPGRAEDASPRRDGVAESGRRATF